MSRAAPPILQPVEFSAIAGWDADDHGDALAAFRRSCAEILAEGHAFLRPIRFGGRREDWLEVCRGAAAVSNPRDFFERNFRALLVRDPARPEGLFTGYYEPEAAGSRAPGPGYGVPVYGKPGDLVQFDAAAAVATGLHYGRIVDGRPAPYFSRRDIEQGALAGRGLEIVWLGDWADAFFIHIQGSGRVRLPDGAVVRLAYAAKNGQPYTGIGALLAARGAFSREEMSMQATRAWMRGNPEEARQLMWENRSFIFFREIATEDAALGPPGAQTVALTPRRSLAVDRSLWAFGTPVWLDSATPAGAPFRRLMVAQDTGTAITGHARGDVFWGAGEEAAATAGHMKSPGRMTVLLPRRLADALLSRQ